MPVANVNYFLKTILLLRAWAEQNRSVEIRGSQTGLKGKLTCRCIPKFNWSISVPEESKGRVLLAKWIIEKKKASANSGKHFFFSQRAQMMFLRVVECLIFFLHPLVARKVVFSWLPAEILKPCWKADILPIVSKHSDIPVDVFTFWCASAGRPIFSSLVGVGAGWQNTSVHIKYTYFNEYSWLTLWW